jgi:hypothetical protein
MTADEQRPFVVERRGGKGRIRLGPEAIWWAQQHGMSLTELAKYLLARDEPEGLEAPELPELPDLPAV